MPREDFLHSEFLRRFAYNPTACQDNLFRDVSAFLCGDSSDILVVNGYAGTGKTTAISAVIRTLADFKAPFTLLAPTGRAAKVLSGYAGSKAYTIHKHIYQQGSPNGEGLGNFTLRYNEYHDMVFIVDEVSLIGIDAGQQTIVSFGSGNLLEDLVKYVRDGNGNKLILIGDAAQLPPVGLDASPALSKEFMDIFGGVEFTHLTTVVRQQKESGILHNATLLRKMIETQTVRKVKFRLKGFDDVCRISGAELIDALSDAYSRYGEDETIVLCRSNRRANRYNAGIRGQVQYKEERLVRDDHLMIVKNCYKFTGNLEGVDFIANGDMARLVKISKYEDRYGLHFASARLVFPDYDEQEITARVILDTLDSESASLTYEQQNELWKGVNEDYMDIKDKRRRYRQVREDEYFNALQLKFAYAITGHKSQGGQWKCVFIDNPLWSEEVTLDDLKWLYTAITRGV